MFTHQKSPIFIQIAKEIKLNNVKMIELGTHRQGKADGSVKFSSLKVGMF